AIQHVSRFNPRATQILIPIDGGKLAVMSGQKSSSSKNSWSTSCCIQCHFDTGPMVLTDRRRRKRWRRQLFSRGEHSCDKQDRVANVAQFGFPRTAQTLYWHKGLISRHSASVRSLA